MKTEKYLFLLLVALNLSSCVISEPQFIENRRTSAGRMVYYNTAMILRGYIVKLNFLQNVNRYMQAAGLPERDSVRDVLLKGFNIRLTNEGTYILRSEDAKVWTIVTGNKSLDAAGTVWSVSCGYAGYGIVDRIVIPRGGFIVEATAPETWKLVIKGCEDYAFMSDATLTVERLEKRPQSSSIRSDYRMEGCGRLASREEEKFLDIGYRILSPMIYRAGIFDEERIIPDLACFLEGAIDMNVVNDTHTEPENVKADLTGSREDEFAVSITFRGLTETWDGGIR